MSNHCDCCQLDHVLEQFLKEHQLEIKPVHVEFVREKALRAAAEKLAERYVEDILGDKALQTRLVNLIYKVAKESLPEMMEKEVRKMIHRISEGYD